MGTQGTDPHGDPDLPDVQALQQGDRDAFDRLLDRHRDGIYGFLRSMVRNPHDAEELAQETFVRAYFRIDQYRPRAPFAAWLYQIARNLVRDRARSRFRRQARRTIPLQDTSDPLPDLQPAPPADPRHTALEDALHRLPDRLREPLVLTALVGYSHEEAARRLGLTPKAVEGKCYRARQALRKILTPG